MCSLSGRCDGAGIYPEMAKDSLVGISADHSSLLRDWSDSVGKKERGKAADI